MPWNVDLRLERTQALTEDERAQVAGFGRTYLTGWERATFRLEPSQGAPVVARGAATLALAFGSDDPARLLVALTALRRLVPEAVLVVEDSLGLVGWDPAGRYELNAGVVAMAGEEDEDEEEEEEEEGQDEDGEVEEEEEEGEKADEDEEDADEDADEDEDADADAEEDAAEEEDDEGDQAALASAVVSPASAAAADVAVAPALLEASLSTRDAAPVLAARIRALPTHADPWREQRSLDTHEPVEVARAVLGVLREVPSSFDVTRVLSNALTRLADRSALRAGMIGLWAEPAPHRDWWRDVARALEPAIGDPALLAAVSAIVLADDGDDERRRAAIDLLGHGGHVWEQVLPVLVERLRRDRERTRDDARAREPAIVALGRLGRGEALSTLVLELAAETMVGWFPTLQALARAAGDAALPWLRRCFSRAGAAEYVIDALEDVPASTPWLHELAGHPEARFREAAARVLQRQGPGELPWVAAVCERLDAVGARRRGVRERCLEELGQPRGDQDADWPALVRACGREPVVLPPVGHALAAMVATDDSRLRALEQVGRAPSAPLLVPLVLALELDVALGRRGHRTASSPEWRRWAQEVPAWRPFAERWGYTAEMGDWIRVHRATLAPAELPPLYQLILDDGADAVAARWPEPRLVLTAAEAIVLDAAERALLVGAQPAAPAAVPLLDGPLPFDAGDLFGVVLEQPPPRTAPATRADAAPILAGSAAGEQLGFVTGTTEVELELDDPTLPWVSVRGVLASHAPRPLRLLAVDLALRDGEGRLTGSATRVLRDQFWHHHPLDVRVGLGAGMVTGATTVDVVVTHELAYHARLVAADLAPWGPELPRVRAPWPHRLAASADGYPRFAASLAVLAPCLDDLRLTYVVELEQRTPLRAPTAGELLVVLRNRGGSVVARASHPVTVDGGGPQYVHGDVRVDLATLRTARRVEVALAGSTRRAERVASFALPGATGPQPV